MVGGRNWQEYIGIAMDSIERETQARILHVLCPELLPMQNGLHTRKDIRTAPYSFKQEDLRMGSTVETTVELSSTIIAEYLGATHFSVPDVHEGEQVRLLNYAGTDQFFWLPLGRDDGIRRTEQVRMFAADESRTVKELNDGNTYFLELDTKYYKRVRISTSNSDGEDYKYLFEIDAVKNNIKIQDDGGNHIYLDSNIPLIRLRNRCNTLIELDETDMNINVPRNLNVRVGGNFNWDHAGHIFGQTGNPVDTTATTLVDGGTGILSHKHCGPPPHTKLASGESTSMAKEDFIQNMITTKYHLTSKHIEVAREASGLIKTYRTNPEGLTNFIKTIVDDDYKNKITIPDVVIYVLETLARKYSMTVKEIASSIVTLQSVETAFAKGAGVEGQPPQWYDWMKDWYHILSKQTLGDPSMVPSIGGNTFKNDPLEPKGIWTKGAKPTPKVDRSVSSPYPGGNITMLNMMNVDYRTMMNVTRNIHMNHTKTIFMNDDRLTKMNMKDTVLLTKTTDIKKATKLTIGGIYTVTVAADVVIKSGANLTTEAAGVNLVKAGGNVVTQGANLDVKAGKIIGGAMSHALPHA